MVIGAYTVAFGILYALPSDPAALLAARNDTAEEAVIEALKQQYGLDRPLWIQYLDGLWGFVTLDFGRSWSTGEEVTTALANAAGSTLLLSLFALLVAVLTANVLAFLATYPRWRVVRSLAASVPPVLFSTPVFWLGFIAIQVFSFSLGLVPAFGNEGWRSLVLPVVVLGVYISAPIAQVLIRSVEQIEEEYWREILVSRGIGRFELYLRHVLPNASLPAITMTGTLFAGIVSGAVIIEVVFSRSGLGRLTEAAVAAQDVPVVLALVSSSAALYVAINLAVDLFFPMIDPRLRARRTVAARVAVEEAP